MAPQNIVIAVNSAPIRHHHTDGEVNDSARESSRGKTELHKEPIQRLLLLGTIDKTT